MTEASLYKVGDSSNDPRLQSKYCPKLARVNGMVSRTVFCFGNLRFDVVLTGVPPGLFFLSYCFAFTSEATANPWPMSSFGGMNLLLIVIYVVLID